MIICPNCDHQNFGEVVQCEACYTPLLSVLSCSNCGLSVQPGASYCGQCGANLAEQSMVPMTWISHSEPRPLVLSKSLVLEVPEENPVIGSFSEREAERFERKPDLHVSDVNIPDFNAPLEHFDVRRSIVASYSNKVSPAGASVSGVVVEGLSHLSETSAANTANTMVNCASSVSVSDSWSVDATQRHSQSVQLVHTQTQVIVDLPRYLTVIHIGKPNDRVSPDVDVSGFEHSEVVSRVHADIYVEGDTYLLEDMGSSNGTYVNNIPLLPGNRYRLRSGDRIALGKGDKVSFIVQVISS